MRNRKLKITEMGRMNVEEFKASEKMPLIVVLDDVRSMYNVGSVFRTADAFRVEALYLCGITSQPPHPEIHKTALGAEDTVAWQHYPTALDAVEALHMKGYTVYSIEQCEGSTLLHHLDFSSRPNQSDKTASPLQGNLPEKKKGYAIILGNEIKGVRQEVVDASDGCIEIPQYGTKHSLNVSTAAGIVIWHFAQQLLIC